MKAIYALILALPAIAYATGTNPPAPSPASQKQAQGQAQKQSQGQEQSQSASADNSQAVTIEDRKQAPSISQGSIFIPECGAGGNAGGSNSSGSAFLGIAYVPAWCQDFKYAAWLISVGDYAGACEVMAQSKVGKRAAKNGIAPPKCSPPVVVQPVEPKPTVVVLQGESCVSKERTEHALLEKCAAK